jgi:hypothetical protein
MSYNAMSIVQTGAAATVLYPSIDDDRQIIPEPLDGQFDPPFQVSMVSVRRKVGNKWVSELQTKDLSFQVWITGSRVLLYCRNFDKGATWVGFNLSGLAVAAVGTAISKGMAAGRRRGKALVGNIRYPWITKVGFAPRAGMGTRETVTIHYIDGTDPTKPECSLTIHLANHVDANRTARHIVERIIAYRYAERDAMDDDEVAKFEALRTSGLKAPAQKGYVAHYVLPTSWPVPNGLSKAPDTVPAFPATVPAPASPPTEPPVIVVTGTYCTMCGSEFLGSAFCTDCGAPVAV